MFCSIFVNRTENSAFRKMLHCVSAPRAADLHELVSGQKPRRRAQEEITVFKSVGCALEDLVAGELLLATRSRSYPAQLLAARPKLKGKGRRSGFVHLANYFLKYQKIATAVSTTVMSHRTTSLFLFFSSAIAEVQHT